MPISFIPTDYNKCGLRVQLVARYICQVLRMASVMLQTLTVLDHCYVLLQDNCSGALTSDAPTTITRAKMLVMPLCHFNLDMIKLFGDGTNQSDGGSPE